MFPVEVLLWGPAVAFNYLLNLARFPSSADPQNSKRTESGEGRKGKKNTRKQKEYIPFSAF